MQTVTTRIGHQKITGPTAAAVLKIGPHYVCAACGFAPAYKSRICLACGGNVWMLKRVK